MGNGSSSDSSSGWELEDGQGPSLCKNKRPLSSVEPEEGGEETQFNMFQYDPSLNGTLQKRSARLCRNGEKPVACRLPVKSYYCASCFKQSRHDDQETVEWVGCKYCRQWFHKGRERARRNVPAHEHCCHMQELVEKRKRNKLWIRHAAESQRKEGIISLKSNQIMVNGSFLRSAHAIGDLDILVLDSPCVPPPNGPPLKCFEVHMHWDFGYFKRLKRQVDIPDLLNKWIDHVQPWREFRVFLYSSSKITKEDLIALFSRKWGDVCLAVNMKKLGMPVDHIGDVVDSIPLATREFSLSVQADKMLCIAPIESQFTKRIQHFIDTKGDYEAEVHIGADFLCIDTSKIRLNLDINFPEFCIAEDGCDEYEIRVGHAQSGRYISLEYEDEDLDDLCAIRLCVSLCLCKPTLEQTVCRHGFFWCNDELEKKLRRLGTASYSATSMGNRFSSSSTSGPSGSEGESESEQGSPFYNELLQNMGNGSLYDSDSSSGSEHEEESEQGPPFCNTFDGYSLLPLEVRVNILTKLRMFKNRMSLLWADRSLYEYCCNHEVLTVESISVTTKERDDATVKVSFYGHDDANLDDDLCGSKSDFVEMHKLPQQSGRGRARYDLPPECRRQMKEVVKRRNTRKLSIRHFVKSQHEEGFITFKAKQLMFNGSFLRSAHAIGDLFSLMLDAPCVPPPSGPPIKCEEAHIHWDFGYLKKWNREVDTEGLFNKWIEHVQPTGVLRLFLHSKVAKEDLIALCSRKWGDVSLVVCLKKLKMPLEHVAELIDVIPLETRDFVLSVRAHLTCDSSIETQLIQRLQHFINMNGEYKADAYIGARSFDIDVDKIRRSLVIPPCPAFCIAEDHEMEFEFRIRHNKSKRYISLEFERKSVEDRCAIRLCVDKCKCDPNLEHADGCEHGFFWCGDEEEEKKGQEC